MQEDHLKQRLLPTLALLGLAVGLSGAFAYLGHQQGLKACVPEFIALEPLAGIIYLIGVYCVEKFSLGVAALGIILAGAVVFRLLAFSAQPSLSEDVYRYQWEGRVQRAHFNPYTVTPAQQELQWAEEAQHPNTAGKTIPTPYPPLAELALSRIESIWCSQRDRR